MVWSLACAGDMPLEGLGEGALCHLLSSRWELCVPVIISLGAPCHLSSFRWESCVICHPFTGSPVSPAVISLGSSCHLLSFREGGLYHLLSFPLGGPCHLPSVVPCDGRLGCNLALTCAHCCRRGGVGLSHHCCPLCRGPWGCQGWGRRA